MTILNNIQEGDKIEFDYYGDSTLAKSYRFIEEMWPSAYNALTLLDWQWTFSTHYGATDGRTLKLNPNGLHRIDSTSNPVGFVSYLLVHEAGHVLGGVSRLYDLLGHIPSGDAPAAELRAFAKRKRMVNIAADHAINLLIDKANAECNMEGKVPFGEDAFPALPNGCCDIKYDNMSAENIYIDLNRNQPDDVEEEEEDEETSGVGDPDGDSDDESGDASDGDSDDESGEESDGDSDDESGEESDDESGEESDGDSDATGDDDQPPTDSDILGKEFPGGGADDIQQPTLEDGETLDEVNRDIEEAVNQVITNSELNSASEGGMIESALRGLKDQRNKREPLDWKQYIRDWQTVRMNDGWTRPFNAPVFNATNGLCAPGRGRIGCGAIVYIVDSSWSMDEALTTDLLVAGQELLDNQRPERLIILSVSDDVRDVITLVPGDTVPEKIKGGGCTKFRPAFQWIEDNEPYCDGIVYLTDGYSNDLRTLEEPACPLLWVSYGVAAVDYPIGDAVDAAPSRAEAYA
tara:strand:+ start:103 stop:1662 length:1560 start_codon:yes stop_codon:yes gene_type:complete